MPDLSSAEKTARWRANNPVKSLLANARHRARVGELEYDLDVTDLLPAPTVCPVLGIPLKYIGQGVGRRYDPHNATLDRIDNSKGYVRGNVIIVSWRANALKKDATLDELRKLHDFYCK